MSKTNFTQKNANREAYKKARDDNPREAREARSLRRVHGGAFGNLPAEQFNFLALGTTGALRDEGKKEKAG